MFEESGVRIEVDQNGWFIATVGDVAIRENNLQAAKDKVAKEITAQAKRQTISLPIVGITEESNRYHGGKREVMHGTIVGVNRTSGSLMIDPTSKNRNWETVLVDTPENEKLLNDCAEAEATAAKLRNQKFARSIKGPSGGRITAEDYGLVLDKVKAVWEEKSKLTTTA